MSHTKESMEMLSEAAERLDNLTYGLKLPMPPAFHIEQLKSILPDIVKSLRAVYVAETGDDPWSTHPKEPSHD